MSCVGSSTRVPTFGSHTSTSGLSRVTSWKPRPCRKAMSSNVSWGWTIAVCGWPITRPRFAIAARPAAASLKGQDVSLETEVVSSQHQFGYEVYAGPTPVVGLARDLRLLAYREV